METDAEKNKASEHKASLNLNGKVNVQFKAKEFREAERYYTEALGVCPECFSSDMAVLFYNRATPLFHLDLKYQAIADCSTAVKLNPDCVRAILKRAQLYEETDKLDEALLDYNTILVKEPEHNAAREACERLRQQIQDRDQEMGQQQRKRRPWTAEEQAAVERHLKKNILIYKVPDKTACDRCLAAEPGLKERDWKAVKFYVKNKIAALKRKISGGGRQ